MCLPSIYGPNVYVDKMRVLVESLLADVHNNLCNSMFFLKIMGVANGYSGGEFILLLFIRVMAAGCWSELRSGCFWEVCNVLVLC